MMNRLDREGNRAPDAGDRYSCLHFDDHSSFAELINEQFGLHWHSMQLSAGRSPIRYAQFESPACGISLTHCRLVQADVSAFQVPAGHTVFSICRSKLPHFQNGYLVDHTSMVVYQGGHSYLAAYAEGWESFDILVADEAVGRQPGLCAELQRLRSGRDILASPNCGQETRRFLDMLSSLYSRADNSGSEHSHEITADVVEAVFTHLPGVLREEFPESRPEGYPRTRRPDVVSRATQLLSESRDEQFKAEDLASELGVSYRLLNYSFREALGVTPYQYILISRLHDARRDLKRDGPAIEELMEVHGFDTPSRFRVQYRRLFGEMPGETRRRAQEERVPAP